MQAQRVFLIMILAACLRGPTRAQVPATFLEPRNFGSGLGVALAVGDFNGDGVPDVATVGIDIGIYLADGHGGFNVQPPIGISGSSIVAADFNGDGALDLAVAGGNGIVLLLGNGDGTFRPPVTYPAVASVLALGDFNGDGIPDVAAVYSQVQVFFGSTSGGLQAGPISPLPSSASVPFSLVSGDFHGDGKTDLALGYQVYHAPADVAVLRGTGDGSFGSPAIYEATGVSYLRGMVTADFNGDGALDLGYAGTSESFSGTVGVLLNNGSGVFSSEPPTTVRPLLDGLATADLNGDGIPDLMAAGSGVAVALLGRGDGTFRVHGQYVLAFNVTAVGIGDFNGDGVEDLVSVNGNTYVNPPPVIPPLTLLLGNGDGTFRSSGAFDSVPYPTAITVADFNHDGKLDVAVANAPPYGRPKNPAITVSLGDGHGRLSKQVAYPVSDPTALVAGDVNNDGNPDVVFVGDYRVGTLPGNGDGTFGTAITSLCPDCGNAVLLADFNHDGKLDVATLENNAPRNGVVVLLGNGDGTFQSPIVYASTLGATALSATDFNNDGNPDLLVSAYAGVYIMLGNPDGSFAAPVLLSGGGRYAVTGDFNGDRNADVAVVLNNENGLAVYLGKGDGTFSTPIAVDVPVIGPPVLVGDFNGDGIPDLLTPAPTNGLAEILLGRGNGNFILQREEFLANLGGGMFGATGDFNGDGKLDVVTAGIWILLNTTGH